MVEKYYWLFLSCIVLIYLFQFGGADNPYRFFDWHVTYGHVYPLGVRQRGILINKQFPGPDIICVTNDNLVINVFNHLDEPFLISWDGIQQRKNSYEDGVYGTTCPIPAGKNFTYKFQVKDQIGSYFYFPSTAFHKAAGGFGGIRVLSRPLIPVPFPPPADDFTLLIGDWYKSNHTVESALRQNFKSAKWVLSKGHSSVEDELRLLDKFQKADSRNFHAWNYRRFVAALKNIPDEDELKYTINVNLLVCIMLLEATLLRISIKF